MSTDSEEDAGVGVSPTLHPRFVRPNKVSPLDFHAAIKQLARSHAIYAYLAGGMPCFNDDKLSTAAQMLAEDAQVVLDLYPGPSLGL